MARMTVTFTISIPPEMAVELEELPQKEHRTRSELLREALRRYIQASGGNVALRTLPASPAKVSDVPQ